LFDYEDLRYTHINKEEKNTTFGLFLNMIEYIGLFYPKIYAISVETEKHIEKICIKLLPRVHVLKYL